jgi:hypothetical protein
MKAVLSFGVALCLLLAPVAPLEAQSQAQTNQLLQGTQVHLVLLNGLSTSVAKEGDPFTASVAEPVYLGSQLILPAGSRVTGQVGAIIRPKHFSVFRGQAAMNLTFKSIEIDHREIPAQMSILAIMDPGATAGGKNRKDVKVEEGQYVEAKQDIKKDIMLVGLGTGGGTVVGAVFSHVVRGLTFGLIGTTAYVMSRKGKEVELPAQTALLVRLDSSVSVPTIAATAALETNGSR